MCAIQIHDIPHMLYYCKLSKSVWNQIDNILNLNLELRHILLIYEHENMEDIIAINYCISVIAYNIYKYWIKLKNSKSTYNPSTYALKAGIISDIKARICIMENRHTHKLHKCSEILRRLHDGMHKVNE